MPSFPNSPVTFPTRRNSDPVGTAITESITVPLAGPFVAALREVPRPGSVVATAPGGAARVVVPYGTPLSPGQVGVRDRDGEVQLHSSDAGLAISFAYLGLGTPASARIINALQDEVAALQAWTLSRPRCVLAIHDGYWTINGASVPVAWDGDIEQVGGTWWSTGSVETRSRIVAPHAGLVAVSYSLELIETYVDSLRACVTLDGSDMAHAVSAFTPDGGNYSRQNATGCAIVPVAAGSIIRVRMLNEGSWPSLMGDGKTHVTVAYL